MNKFPSPSSDLVYTCCAVIVIVNSEKMKLMPLKILMCPELNEMIILETLEINNNMVISKH